MQILKADGTTEPFDSKKLIFALTHAGAKYPVAREIADQIEEKCFHSGDSNAIKTDYIYKMAFKQLKNISRNSALKFSLKRAMLELGPSGFPFEEFVAEVWRAKGYTAITGQIVYGGCVSHEVDVIAWKDDELVMIEAKYHSDGGSRTDLKTALYVKARYDDIRQQTFSMKSFDLSKVVDESLLDMHTFERGSQNVTGSKPMPAIPEVPQKLTEGWLITNTHFSDTAITYASCNGLRLLSYDYPEGNSLQDEIIKYKLYPLTCLTTLTTSDKRELMLKNITLCKTLHTKNEIMVEMGFSKEKIHAVLAEISSLM